MNGKKLTAKQEKFCQEYLIDLVATQAAIRAGYSKKTAEQIGWENLKKPQIIAQINKQRELQSKRTELTADWVLKKLREEAVSTEDDATAGSRIRATELIGKHLGMFVDRVSHEGNVGNVVIVIPDNGRDGGKVLPPSNETARRLLDDSSPG